MKTVNDLISALTLIQGKHGGDTILLIDNDSFNDDELSYTDIDKVVMEKILWQHDEDYDPLDENKEQVEKTVCLLKGFN